MGLRERSGRAGYCAVRASLGTATEGRLERSFLNLVPPAHSATSHRVDMYDVASEEMTPEFLECWRAAGAHLNRQVQDGIQSWIRAQPYPPFLEHLSFRLGNQLFFGTQRWRGQHSQGRGELAPVEPLVRGRAGPLLLRAFTATPGDADALSDHGHPPTRGSDALCPRVTDGGSHWTEAGQ